MKRNDKTPSRRLSISEMARIHKISRQTLIYYDKIDLFKPDIVEENGYRFYSVEQIPTLREICFLRSIDMPLDEIRKNNKYNASKSTIELLTEQRNKIDDQIDILMRQKRQIENRLNLYSKSKNMDSAPYMQFFPERKLICADWNPAKRTREEMRTALIKAWNSAEKFDILPTSFYGALLDMEDVKKGDPFAHIKSCFIVDADEAEHIPDIVTLKSGEYVCSQKFGMCYDKTCLDHLLNWIDENGYEICGDIYDESLMDASIYHGKNEVDFSELQIPVRVKM